MISLHQTRTVTKAHLDAVFSVHQFLKTHTIERRIYFLLDSGILNLDRETGQPMLYHKHLAYLAGANPKKYNTEKDLLSLKENVLPDFTWKKHDYENLKTRVVVNSGLGEENKFWLGEHSPDRVWVEHLHKMQLRHVEDNHRKLKAYYQSMIYSNPDQQLIANYLHSRRLKTYIDLRDENIEAAFAYAREPYNEVALRQLHAFYDNPFPFYDMSEPGNTVRLFASTLQFMQSRLRHILTPYSRELDIQNCQLSIFAGRFGITSIQKELASGTSVWPGILSYMQIPEQYKVEAKDYLKEALYSLLYDMQARYVNRNLDNHLSGIYRDANKTFLSHPLIQEVQNGLVYAKKKIRKEKGMLSPYGWQSHDPKHQKISSFLAGINQSFEMALMASVYKEVMAMEAGRNADVEILLHQHDGVSINFKHMLNHNLLLNRFQKAIAIPGKEFGIPATLSW